MKRVIAGQALLCRVYEPDHAGDTSMTASVHDGMIMIFICTIDLDLPTIVHPSVHLADDKLADNRRRRVAADRKNTPVSA
jgi:hypothetical protein